MGEGFSSRLLGGMKQQTVNQQKEGLRHSDHCPESVKNMAIYFTQKPMGIPDHLIITAHTQKKQWWVFNVYFKFI